MEKLKQFGLNNISWLVWLLTTLTLAFFIVHNAQWLIGDDAIIIRKTGSGIFFSIFDTITPESGRFYPLAYYAYNILLFFNNGVVSVQQHYILIALSFLLFSFFIFFLNKEILKKSTSEKYVTDSLALLFLFMIIQRSYSTFSHIFTTIWIDYLLVIVFIFFTYQFYKSQKIYFAIIAVLSISYCVFCFETIFILPISTGFLPLLFSLNNLSKKEKWFSISLIFVGLFFLLTYYFVVYINIIEAYDGSHGSENTLFQNAINMLMNQKLMLVALLILVLRLYFVFIKKEKYHKFYDTMLLTGFVYTLGCFILVLNWGMYYVISVLFVSFPILYYFNKYFKMKYLSVIILFLSVFYIRNYPKKIIAIQRNRIETKELIETVKAYSDMNYTFVWKDRVLVENNWDKTMSNWKKTSLSALLSHEFNDPSFKFIENSNVENILFFYPAESYKILKSIDRNKMTIISEKHGIVIGY